MCIRDSRKAMRIDYFTDRSISSVMEGLNKRSGMMGLSLSLIHI